MIAGSHRLLYRFSVLLFGFVALEAACSSDKESLELLDLEERPLYTYAVFPVGVAVGSPSLLDDEIYFRSIAAHHFNRMTPGNNMKMDAVHPGEGHYTFSDADNLVAFAGDHDQAIHGHVLVWHYQVPSWMENYQGSSEDWEVMLKDHIQTVVRHFDGVAGSWDVVNEAFEENGVLRRTIWREHIGDDYIAKCFQWAREVGSDVTLFYNDFNLSYNADKMKAVLAMVDDFRSRDPQIPIDGIGFQMHVYDDAPPLLSIQAAVDSVVARDLLVHFSEVDVQVNRYQIYAELTDELNARLRQRYYDIATVYQSIPPELQAGITIWGVSDSDSWIRDTFGRLDWPLLFDEEYQPKPAFWGFAEGLETEGRVRHPTF